MAEVLVDDVKPGLIAMREVAETAEFTGTVETLDADRQRLGQRISNLGINIERCRGRCRAIDLEINIAVERQRPAPAAFADDAFELGVLWVLVELMIDATDLEADPVIPRLALGPRRDAFDAQFDPVGTDMVVPVERRQRQIQTKLEIRRQSVRELRSDAEAMQRPLLNGGQSLVSAPVKT